MGDCQVPEAGADLPATVVPGTPSRRAVFADWCNSVPVFANIARFHENAPFCGCFLSG